MTREQERAAAKRRHERREQLQVERTRRQHRRQARTGVAVGAVVVLAVGAVVVVDRLRDDPSGTSTAASATSSADVLPPACPSPTGTSTRTPDPLTSPGVTIDTTATYTMTLSTNCGDLSVLLDDRAPATVSSFQYLASQKYFDGTPCHRLTTEGIYVLQCGDPTGTGTGGPGYELPDENLPTADGVNYPAGTVAMANAGPGTGGSQFFLVYQDTTLPAGYTVFGYVTDGLDVLRTVADAGADDPSGDGAPNQPVTLESVTVTEQEA